MHEIGEDHVHAEGDPAALERAHPLWRGDRVVLRSVGIDVGSSTSHLIFSTLEMRRQSAVLSSRFELVDRCIDYASPIILTPFGAGETLDVTRLSAFVQDAYAQANFGKADVDTGAVITTGNAARKDNAETVVRLFSEQAGKFVCASAGPLLEAKMAAYGSGAVARSAQGAPSPTVLSIDIGGGTSKLAIARGGRVIETTAINIGARLIVFDEQEKLTRREAAAGIVARNRGIELEVGAPISEKTRLDLAAALVDTLLEVAARAELSSLARALMIADPLRYTGEIDVVIFSGGAAEYFYRRDVPHFGDLGPLLARLLRRRLPQELPEIAVEPPAHAIRATVIGASQFTAQVSGNTLYIPNPDLLPLRNLQVVIADLTDVPVSARDIAAAVRARLQAAEVGDASPVALAIRWPHGPAYPRLDALACGIAKASAVRQRHGQPLVLVLDVDVARLVGTILSARTRGYENIVCIDGVDLHDFDYIDIGEQRADSRVVTVVVKSLIFTG